MLKPPLGLAKDLNGKATRNLDVSVAMPVFGLRLCLICGRDQQSWPFGGGRNRVLGPSLLDVLIERQRSGPLSQAPFDEESLDDDGYGGVVYGCDQCQWERSRAIGSVAFDEIERLTVQLAEANSQHWDFTHFESYSVTFGAKVIDRGPGPEIFQQYSEAMLDALGPYMPEGLEVIGSQLAQLGRAPHVDTFNPAQDFIVVYGTNGEPRLMRSPGGAVVCETRPIVDIYEELDRLLAADRRTTATAEEAAALRRLIVLYCSLADGPPWVVKRWMAGLLIDE